MKLNFWVILQCPVKATSCVLSPANSLRRWFTNCIFPIPLKPICALHYKHHLFILNVQLFFKSCTGESLFTQILPHHQDFTFLSSLEALLQPLSSTGTCVSLPSTTHFGALFLVKKMVFPHGNF